MVEEFMVQRRRREINSGGGGGRLKTRLDIPFFSVPSIPPNKQ